MIYFIVKFAAILVVFLTTRFKVKGKANIPLEGPLLVVSNHMSVADPVFVGISLRRKVIFMAKEELFRNPLVRYFISRFGAFPVYRGGANIDTLRQANNILKQGKVLGMFPEGKRSAGQMIEAHPGSAMIAAHNHATILPVAITGSEKIHGWRWIPGRPRVVLNIGQPFKLPVESTLNKEEMVKYTVYIMRKIAELMPEKYHGKYAVPESK